MFAIHRAAATLLVAFGFTDATPNTATLSEAILGDHSSYFERQSGASGVDRLLMWLAERFPEDNDQGALWAAHQGRQAWEAGALRGAVLPPPPPPSHLPPPWGPADAGTGEAGGAALSHSDEL